MNKTFKANKKWKSTRYYKACLVKKAIKAIRFHQLRCTTYAQADIIRAATCPTGDDEALFKIRKLEAISRLIISTAETTSRILKGEA